MTPTFSVIDLFAGVGGFSEGFLRVNRYEKEFQFALKLLVDSDPTASFTFKKNYPRIPFLNADLGKISADEILKLVRMRRGELDFGAGLDGNAGDDGGRYDPGLRARQGGRG